MAQVAFDTLQFVETLESSGLPKEQARAISLAVRQSHEAVDVATQTDIKDLKRDLSESHHELSAKIDDVRKDLSAEIADVRKDMAAGFEKTDAQIAGIRKDLSAEIVSVKRDITDVQKELSAEIVSVKRDIIEVREDMTTRFEKMELRLTVRLGVMMAAAAGIITAVLRIPA